MGNTSLRSEGLRRGFSVPNGDRNEGQRQGNQEMIIHEWCTCAYVYQLIYTSIYHNYHTHVGIGMEWTNIECIGSMAHTCAKQGELSVQ